MKCYFYAFLVSYALFFFLSRLNREPVVTPLGTFLVPGDVLHFWRLLLSRREKRDWTEIALQSCYVIPLLLAFSAMTYATYQLFVITVPVVEMAAHALSKSLIIFILVGHLAVSLDPGKMD